MKRWLVVVALCLGLTGCGAYAAAFTPSESLPSSDEIAATWVAKDGGTVELTSDGTFTTEGADAPDGRGTWTQPEQPASPFPYYLLTYSTGETVQLHHQNGFLSEENVYFVRGVVDDGDWYRLYRAED